MPRLPADDAGLWQRAMRDVTPLRAPKRDRGHPARPAADAGETPAVPVPVQPPLDRFAGLDRASAERLKRGRYLVEAKLDLHGMTQAEAHRALTGFLAAARTAGRRCVLVVTGQGRMSGGILKAAVPRWLAEPALRPHLLAIAPARPSHGGGGALYLLLRKAPRPV